MGAVSSLVCVRAAGPQNFSKAVKVYGGPTWESRQIFLTKFSEDLLRDGLLSAPVPGALLQ